MAVVIWGAFWYPRCMCTSSHRNGLVFRSIHRYTHTHTQWAGQFCSYHTHTHNKFHSIVVTIVVALACCVNVFCFLSLAYVKSFGIVVIKNKSIHFHFTFFLFCYCLPSAICVFWVVVVVVFSFFSKGFLTDTMYTTFNACLLFSGVNVSSCRCCRPSSSSSFHLFLFCCYSLICIRYSFHCFVHNCFRFFFWRCSCILWAFLFLQFHRHAKSHYLSCGHVCVCVLKRRRDVWSVFHSFDRVPTLSSSILSDQHTFYVN